YLARHATLPRNISLSLFGQTKSQCSVPASEQYPPFPRPHSSSHESSSSESSSKKQSSRSSVISSSLAGDRTFRSRRSLLDIHSTPHRLREHRSSRRHDLRSDGLQTRLRPCCNSPA